MWYFNEGLLYSAKPVFILWAGKIWYILYTYTLQKTLVLWKLYLFRPVQRAYFNSQIIKWIFFFLFWKMSGRHLWGLASFCCIVAFMCPAHGAKRGDCLSSLYALRMADRAFPSYVGKGKVMNFARQKQSQWLVGHKMFCVHTWGTGITRPVMSILFFSICFLSRKLCFIYFSIYNTGCILERVLKRNLVILIVNRSDSV